jgi:hypothetical protein
MSRINPIPNWVYTGSLPAFYDVESGTAIEQTARLHGAVKSLIDDWNKYANELKTTLESFEKEITDKETCFEDSMVTLIHNYIHQIDEKIAAQNLIFEDVKNNMVEVATGIVEEMFNNGEVVITTNYNEQTESLDLVAGTGGVE